MKQVQNRLFLLTPVAIAVVSFLFYQFFFPYHLFFKEQIQLFLYTPEYIFSYLHKPGWLAALGGDFLTQFFYLRGGGPLVISLLLVVEWWLIKQVLQTISVSKITALWAVLPVAADLTANLALLYTPRNSLSLILVIIAFLLISSIRKKWLATSLFILLTASGQWLFGNAIIVLPFLLLFSKNIYRSRISAKISVLIILISIYIGRSYYLLPVRETFLYPAVSIKGFLPLLVFVVTITLAELTLLKGKHEHFSKWLAVALLPLVLFTGFKLNANFGLEKILSFDSETYFGHNEKVLLLAEKYQIKNRVATYYANIALAKKGQLAESLLDFYQPGIHGLILPVSQYEYWQTIFFSNELYYLLGDMNMAQHSAMLGNTFSPYNRSSRMMQRLAEINMVNEDYSGAGKFLKMLDKTLFHRKWAEEKMKENNPESQSNWLIQKRKQIAKTDTIRTSFDYVKSIEFLVEQNPQNRIALDYLLCYHLLNKDLVSFKNAYDRFAKPQFGIAPKVYGEALLILLFREKASEEIIQEYKIQPVQVHDFLNYTSRFEEVKGDLTQLTKDYGKSYWFYYHFATITEGEE